jgi:peptidoglycan/LPS O-acetylase OafA/YrhL
MNRKNHLYSLDLLRGFSGYGVAFCHLHAFIYKSIHLEYLSLLFVEFFFVLSGFVLYPQLIQLFNNKNNLFLFYQRRWIRTLPLYFIVIFLVSSIFDEVLGKDFFKYLLFIQKIIPNFLSSDYYPVAWSLSIEEFFYLFFPLILIFLGKNNLIKKVIILFTIIMIVKFLLADKVESDFFRTGTLFRFDAILLGFILRFFQDKLFKFKYISLTLLVVLFFVFYFSEAYIFTHNEEYITKISFIILLQILSLLTLNTFLIFESIMKIKIIKNFSILISKQTYSVYLVHIIFIYFLEKMQFSVFNTVVIYALLLFIFSTLIYYFIESPLLKMRPKLK